MRKPRMACALLCLQITESGVMEYFQRALEDPGEQLSRHVGADIGRQRSRGSDRPSVCEQGAHAAANGVKALYTTLALAVTRAPEAIFGLAQPFLGRHAGEIVEAVDCLDCQVIHNDANVCPLLVYEVRRNRNLAVAAPTRTPAAG
jgi:hypothetical protein